VKIALDKFHTKPEAFMNVYAPAAVSQKIHLNEPSSTGNRVEMKTLIQYVVLRGDLGWPTGALVGN
jgi:hypothetical protein